MADGWDGVERRAGVADRRQKSDNDAVVSRFPGRRRSDFTNAEQWERWEHWRDMPRRERIDYLRECEERIKATPAKERILYLDRLAMTIEARVKLEMEENEEIAGRLAAEAPARRAS